MKLLYIASLFFFLVACTKASTDERTTKYYDTKSFVERTIKELNQSKPQVEKTWIYQTKEETKSINDIDWDKELKSFIDADINKSSFVTSYDSAKSENSVRYFLKTAENLPVKEIYIVFDSSGNPTEISSKEKSENYYFKTASEIQLNLKEGKLAEYNIKSVQKLLWFSPDTTSVLGKILN